jgi:neutral amino acid transport system permease protein
MDTAQLLINGLAVGSIISLVAVGLTLTFGILRLPNFAQGDLMTVGAYMTWVSNVAGLNIWLSMIVGAIGTVIVMLVTEVLLWKPMRNVRAQPTTLIIISIGLALFLRSAILLIWGGSNQSYDLPILPALDIFGLKVAYYRIIAIGLSLLAIVILHFLLQNSKIGKANRNND